MQFGGTTTDPFLFEAGGTISGDYEFSESAGIKLEQTDGKISDASDADNHLSFKPNMAEFNKGLTVVGPLIAPNWSNNAQYPANPAFTTVLVNQNADVQGALHVNQNAAFDATVSANVLESDTHVKATSVKDANDYTYIQSDPTEVHIGGGARADIKISATNAHIGFPYAKLDVEPTKATIHTSANTSSTFEESKIEHDLDQYAKTMRVMVTPPDPGLGIGTLVNLFSTITAKMQAGGSGNHQEMRRRMATDIHFIDDARVVHSFAVRPQEQNSIHLSNAQLDETDANSLINKTGADLMNSLQTVRNPRTHIAGTEAQFGLHQQITQAAGAVPVHLLLTQPSETDASFLQTQVDRQVLNCTNKSVGVGFEVAYKGYDANDVLTNQGTRMAVSGQDEVGKIYLGKWDNGLPADSAAEANYSHVNVAGSVRYSKVPVGTDISGDIVAEITPTGLHVDDIRAKGAQLDFHDAVDFSNATVTGISGTGVNNAVDVPGGIRVTGTLETTGSGHNMLAGTTYFDTPSPGNGTVHINGDNIFTNTVGQVSAHWQFVETANNAYANLRMNGVSLFDATIDNNNDSTMTSEIKTVTFNGQHSINGPVPPGLPGTYTPGHFIPLQVEWRDFNNAQAEPNPTIANFWTSGKGRIFSVRGDEIDSQVKIVAPNFGSSGNFTSCHCVEPVSQTIQNCVGKICKSSGVYCARGDDGTKYVVPKNAPTLAHAMCSVELCETDEDPAFLGVVSTVEQVHDEYIDHQHGGITIRSKYAGEADGYKVLRVAASGDAMALICGDGSSAQNVAVGSMICSSDVRKNYGNITTYLFDGATQGSNTLSLYTNTTTGQEFLQSGTGQWAAGYLLQSDGTPGDRYSSIQGTPALFATRDSFTVNGGNFNFVGIKPDGSGWNATFTNWDVMHDFNNTQVAWSSTSGTPYNDTLLEMTGGDGLQYYKFSGIDYGFLKTANGTAGDLYEYVTTATPVHKKTRTSWTPSTNEWYAGQVTSGTQTYIITGWSATNPDWQGGFAQVQSGTAKKSYSIGKALMAVDFSQSVATLQQTFASVESFQGYDGITYTTLLCPIVFC